LHYRHASAIVSDMNNNTQLQEIISSVVRTIEEDTFLDLVNDGVESTTAFEYALNSTWDLPEDLEEAEED
jgi:hypothetical protein